MTARKIFGYIFIVIALLLTLAIVGGIPNIFSAVFGLFKVFTGTVDGYETGKVIGKFIYWILHIAATISLWVYGTRWIKNDAGRTTLPGKAD